MKRGILILSLILNFILFFSLMGPEKSQSDQCGGNIKFSELQKCQTLELELNQLREEKLAKVKQLDANFSYMYHLEELQNKSFSGFDQYVQSECKLRLIMGMESRQFTCEETFFKSSIASLKSDLGK